MHRSTIALAVLSLAAAGPSFAQSADAPPTTPGNFRATLYDKAGGELFWQRSSDDRGAVRGYEITRNGESLGIRDALSFYDASLQPGVPYTFTVAAIDNAGQRSGVATTTLGGGTSVPPPAAPRAVRADVYSRRSAELFWEREPAALALRYEIRRDGRVVGTTNGVSYYTNALAGGTDYAFEVIAIDRQGRRSSPSRIGLRTDGSAPSNPSTPPTAGAPSAPAELRFDVYSTFAVELFWRREPGALRYEILLDGREVATTDGVSYNTSALRPGTDFTFEVIAIDRDGRRSEPARIAVRTDGPARSVDTDLGAPANLRAEVYSRTAAELFWDRASTPGLSYEIRRDGDLVGTTNGTSFFDDGLEGSTRYGYEVFTLGDNRRSTASTVEARTGGLGQETTLELRDGFDAFDRPEALDALDEVLRFYEEALPDDRPFVVTTETSTPFSSDPLVEGMAESVRIDIDATGTGPYRDVSEFQDLDTVRRESAIATRTNTGSSIVWSGANAFSDTSSGIQRSFEFTTEISAIDERTRRQNGELRKESSGDFSSFNQPIDLTYDLTTGVVADFPECDPLTGTIVYTGAFNVRTGPSDFEAIETTTTIAKQPGERSWTVRRTTLGGDLVEEFLVSSIGVAPYCDFPEL